MRRVWAVVFVAGAGLLLGSVAAEGRPLIDGARPAGGASLTDPSSGRVAYVRLSPKHRSSWLEASYLDGGGRATLTPHYHRPTSVWDFAWSPDGTKVVYVVEFGLGRRSLFVVNADGTGRHRLANWRVVGRGLTSVSWAPDSAKVAFGIARRDWRQRPSDVALHIVNADGTDLHNAPVPPRPKVPEPIVYLSPVGWQPDGQGLIFTQDVYSYEVRWTAFQYTELYRLDVDTGRLSSLRKSQGFPHDVYKVAPGGTRIASYPFAGGAEVLVLDPDGGSPQLFTIEIAGRYLGIADVTWLGDDQSLLAYAHDEYGEPYLATIDVRTGTVQPISLPLADHEHIAHTAGDRERIVIVAESFRSQPPILRLLDRVGSLLAEFPLPAKALNPQIHLIPTP